MIGQFFHTMIVASRDEEWLESVLSHLNIWMELVELLVYKM